MQIDVGMSPRLDKGDMGDQNKSQEGYPWPLVVNYRNNWVLPDPTVTITYVIWILKCSTSLTSFVLYQYYVSVV